MALTPHLLGSSGGKMCHAVASLCERRAADERIRSRCGVTRLGPLLGGGMVRDCSSSICAREPSERRGW